MVTECGGSRVCMGAALRAWGLRCAALFGIVLGVGGLLLWAPAGLPPAAAQATASLTGVSTSKSCAEPFTGGGANNAGVPLVTDCTLGVTIPAPAGVATLAGASLSVQDIMLDPNACFAPGGTSAGTSTCASGTVSVATGPVAIPAAGATTTATNPACPSGESIALDATGTSASVSCSLPPIVVVGPTNLCEELDLTLFGGPLATALSGKFTACPPNPAVPSTPTNSLTGATATKSCAPPFTGASPSATKVTDCTLVFSAAAGSQFNNGTTLVFDVITAPNAVFSTASVGGGGQSTTGCENGVGGGGVLDASNLTFTCVVGPIIVSGPTTLCDTAQIRDPFGNVSDKLALCPPISSSSPQASDVPATSPVASGSGGAPVGIFPAGGPASVPPGGTLPQGQLLPLAPSASGVICGGIFFPNAVFCGLTGAFAGAPVSAAGSPVSPATLVTPGGTGVTCSGIFFPNAVSCGNVGGH